MTGPNPNCLLRNEIHSPHQLAGPGGNKPGAKCDGLADPEVRQVPDCRCPTPTRPTGREPERLPPYECTVCGGYACEYAGLGDTRCPASICDCFIYTHPDSPRDLHPEAFVVGPVDEAAEDWAGDSPDWTSS